MIEKVTLQNFRNFKTKDFEFSDKITVIVGPNASGKTNMLEAIYLFSTGRSFKAKIEADSINYDSNILRVIGRVGDTGLEVVITRGFIDIGGGTLEKVVKKKLLVNGVSRRLIDFAGNFKVVLFAPSDMDLVTASPSLRRRFLDNVLFQMDREYRRSLLSYDKGLRQRNKLLFRIREEGISRNELSFWNHLLIHDGQYISQKRTEFIDFVNRHPSPNNKDLHLSYDKSEISEARLDQYKDAEIGAATTLVGPHRDDFIFEIQRGDIMRSLSSFGSRGEQRMGVLWLKMAELNFIEEKTGERPTLLLDDIFSELDHEHRDMVMEISKKQQTIITTADEHFLDKKMIFDKIELST